MRAETHEEPALLRLKRLTDEALRGAGVVDLPEERFSPHITLSRLKQPASVSLKNLARTKAEERFGEMTITSFTLFRSFLRPSGAIHEPVERYCSPD
ncbi:MAG: hypothetical protein LBB66_06825 [Desulfovibrio sp.]|nr:hypothetical protein [Desulfovibrio sp.]